jgi:hypothetical protein
MGDYLYFLLKSLLILEHLGKFLLREELVAYFSMLVNQHLVFVRLQFLLDAPDFVLVILDNTLVRLVSFLDLRLIFALNAQEELI